ncbi:uncharacterized protein LOC131022908 [Salvia miltiorrhiza]|uniref:uncharacterized protein LOC131022908 n=1 Tax=Salvia miltiorrhiza TaxID=226208 RepID=UPI0025AB8336|nr:uncharacterized protein LOC131022908 [Salvia miltiorrhiza]
MGRRRKGQGLICMALQNGKRRERLSCKPKEVEERIFEEEKEAYEERFYRYNMIFVPFIEKDNHGRCVMFGAGLISHEDEESYSWVLQKDFEMSGLFRTTSMSENEDGFFRRYFNKGSNLVEFFMHFECALEAQRNKFDLLNSADESCFPKLVTELPIERSGVYVVDDGNGHKFNVGYSNLNIKSIPDKYIASHWRKFVDIKKTDSIGGSVVVVDNDIISRPYAKANGCIALVHGDSVRMKELLQAFEVLHDSFIVSTGSKSNSEMFDEFYGCPVPEEIDICSPDVVKTKGSGRRIKSSKEKAISKAEKPKRRCSKCKQMRHHDARNCDEEPALD